MMQKTRGQLAQRFMDEHVLVQTSYDLLMAEMPWLTQARAERILVSVGGCWAACADRAESMNAMVSFPTLPAGDAALLGALQHLPLFASELLGSLPADDTLAAGTAQLELLAACSIVIGIVGPRLASAAAVGIVNRNIAAAK